MYLEACEYGDETTMFRVAVVAVGVANNSPVLPKLLVRWWAGEYR